MKKRLLMIGLCGLAVILTGTVATNTVNKLLIQPRTVSSWGELFEEYLDFRAMHGPIVPPSVSYEDVFARMNAGDFSFLAED